MNGKQIVGVAGAILLCLAGTMVQAESFQVIGTVAQVRTNGLVLTQVLIRLKASEKPANGKAFFEYQGDSYLSTGQDLFVRTRSREFVDRDVVIVQLRYDDIYSATNAAGDVVTLHECEASGPVRHFVGKLRGPIYRGWHPVSTNEAGRPRYWQPTTNGLPETPKPVPVPVHTNRPTRVSVRPAP